MLMTIEHIINLHKNKTGFVIANGPSTNKYIPKFQGISKNKHDNLIFVCNEIDVMLKNIGLDLIKDVNPDFWVLANSIQTIKTHYSSLNELRKNNGILAYADSVDLTEDPESLLEINFIQYDQRHFYKKNCAEGFRECCKKCLVNKNPKKTIQEHLSEYTGYNKLYGTGSTVALHMLSLAIIAGCKKIYISGVDLNYNLGYIDNKTTNNDSFDAWIPDILNDFNTINESAKLIGVEIINLNNFSPLKTIFKTSEEII